MEAIEYAQLQTEHNTTALPYGTSFLENEQGVHPAKHCAI